MIKSKQLVGTGIVDQKSGKIIGKVASIIFYPGRKKILGFTVESGKWLKKQKILPVKYISCIGSDKIMTISGDVLIDYEKYPEFTEAMDEKDRILGLSVITCKGEELGYIEDIIIEEKNCTIEGYVLTDGIVEDIIKGKTIVPFAQEMIFGEDAVIISDSYKNIILRNDISLKKVFSNSRRLKN